MPYIKEKERHDHDPLIGMSDFNLALNPGQLNYQITRLIQAYFVMHPNYQGINDVIGALEGAKMEFYRRVAAPYEDKKILENGDVYV